MSEPMLQPQDSSLRENVLLLGADMRTLMMTSSNMATTMQDLLRQSMDQRLSNAAMQADINALKIQFSGNETKYNAIEKSLESLGRRFDIVHGKMVEIEDWRRESKGNRKDLVNLIVPAYAMAIFSMVGTSIQLYFMFHR